MIAEFLTLVLVNTYSWMGGQGMCAYDFALHESDEELTNVRLVLAPQYNPSATASGRTTLDELILTLDSIGGDRVNWGKTASADTDCNVEGFTVVDAHALKDGKPVDIMNRTEIETYKPTPIRVGGP